MQTYVLYMHNKPLVLAAPGSAALHEKSTTDKLTRLSDPDPAMLPSLLKKLAAPAVEGYLIESRDVPSFRQHLLSLFEIWEAGGGLVENEAGEVLLMFRRGHWDLPKGKLDEGETLEACALREVKEETGLVNLRLGEKLCVTRHAYQMDERSILKQTTWYRMLFTGTELTVPQIEEDIEDIQWISRRNIGKYLPYSYPNIREVFSAAGYDKAEN